MHLKTLLLGAGLCLTASFLKQSPAKSTFAMSAIVYENADWSRGADGDGYGSTVYFGPAYPNTPNFAADGVYPKLNDKISFIEIMQYCEVTVYTDAGYGGSSQRLFADNSKLITKVNLAKYYPAFNDNISSLKTSCSK